MYKQFQDVLWSEEMVGPPITDSVSQEEKYCCHYYNKPS